MKLYVAGPMRAIPMFNWPAFEDAASALRALGFDVISPTEIDEDTGVVLVARSSGGRVTCVQLTDAYNFDDVIARDLEAVAQCDGIVLLDGWEDSVGAKMELATAARLGLRVFLGVPAVRDLASEVRVVDPRTGGAKGSKPCQLGWVSPAGLRALGEVAGFGALKYSPTNYRRGFKHSLSFNAMLRHVLAYLGGEDRDPESGLPHLGHAAWHAVTLIQLAEDYPELDDRYGRPASESEESA